MDAEASESAQPTQYGEEPTSPQAQSSPPTPVPPPTIQSSERYGWRVTPIQEPNTGAAFMFQELARIQLMPLLVVQIDCWDPETEQFIVPPPEELATLVVMVSVQTIDGEDASLVRLREDDTVAHSTLYGGRVQMTHLLPSVNDHNLTGCYAFFSDLSIRVPGEFRLRFWLQRVSMDPDRQQPSVGSYLDVYHTGGFRVVPLHQFVAPPTTEMTTHFAGLGIDLHLQDANWDLDHA